MVKTTSSRSVRPTRGVIWPESQADNAELPAPVMTRQITQCSDGSEGCSNHSLTGSLMAVVVRLYACVCACVRVCGSHSVVYWLLRWGLCKTKSSAATSPKRLNGHAGGGRGPPQKTARRTRRPPAVVEKGSTAMRQREVTTRRVKNCLLEPNWRKCRGLVIQSLNLSLLIYSKEQ